MASVGIGHDSALKRALGYRKLHRDTASILLLESGYHLQHECRVALTRLGHRVTSINVDGADAPTVMQRVLMGCVESRVDFVLAINHIGFDTEGSIGGVLDALEMPVAVWYVDSPFFVLRRAEIPAPAMTTLFVWERTLMRPLALHGARDVQYLPLGCDVARFTFEPRTTWRYPIAFVGDSMRHAQKKWTHRLTGREKRLAKDWEAALLDARQSLDATARAALAQPWDALATATFNATAKYRRQLLEALPPGELHLFGDPGWQQTLPHAEWHGPVSYGEGLAALYRDTRINFNATSLQMPTAVNQRVFDAPAAGGFILTDAQSDVAEHFELGNEAIVYRSVDELREHVARFKDDGAERRRIVDNARRRINAHHTYEQRLRQLVSHMRRRHGVRAESAHA